MRVFGTGEFSIAFFGDSLVSGIPGVPFIPLLEELLAVPGSARASGSPGSTDPSGGSIPADIRIFNFGKIGDTVVSLRRRVEGLERRGKLAAGPKSKHLNRRKAEKDEPPPVFDLIFLWIGTNDVYVKVSRGAPIIKRLLRQPWAENHEEFADCCRETARLLCGAARQLILLPPLFMGEDISNPYNREFEELAGLIQKIAAEFNNCRFFDLRERFRDMGLADGPGKDYLPRSPLKTVFDAVLLRSRQRVDEKASQRGLRYTLDGVHFNGAGAEIMAELCAEVCIPYIIENTGRNL